MSTSEEIRDLLIDNDCSEDVSQDQLEKIDIKPTRTANGNLISVTEPASEPQRLHSSRSLEVSNLHPTPPSQAPNIHKLDENAGVDFSQDLRDLTRFSRGDDHVTFRQHSEISVSGLEESDTNGANAIKKDMLPVSSGRKDDFTSPPEQGAMLMRISLSKNLKETYATPGSDAVSSFIERLRKTSENDSAKPGSKTESHGLNFNFTPLAKSWRTPKVLNPHIPLSCHSASQIRRLRKTPETDPAKPGSKTESYLSNLSFSAPAISSKTIPKVLNPHLSCHSPTMRNLSAANVPSRVLEFNTPDQKGKINQNRPVSSIRSGTPHTQSISLSTEMLDLRIRGSLSDEIMTSRNSPVPYESDRLQEIFSESHSQESTASSSLGLHRRSGSEGTLTSENSTEVRTQPDQSDSRTKSHSKETPLEISKVINRAICVVKSLLRGNPSNGDSTSSTNPQSTPFNRLKSRVTEILASNYSTTLRNNPEVNIRQNRNDPLQQRSHERVLARESSASSSPSEMVSRVEGLASRSSHQPTVTRGSLASYPRDSSSGDSQSVNASERTRNMFDRHSEYVVQARFILQFVLKEILHLRGQDDSWRLFEASLRCISESGSDQAYAEFSTRLTSYLIRAEYTLWNRKVFKTQELNAESSLNEAQDRFIYTVVTTLARTLGLKTIHSDFDSFLVDYEKFRSFYLHFAESPIVYSVLDTDNEVYINRVKILKEKLFKLWLRALSAFRLLLIYIGENSDEESVMRFMDRVRDEDDRTFLRGSKI